MTLRRPSDRPSVRPENLNMDNISETNSSTVTKLGPKVVLWQDLSKHTIEGDLEPRSRSQGDLENLKKWTFAYFSVTNSSRALKPIPHCCKWQDLYRGIWHDGLDLGSRSLGDLENAEKWTFADFSDTN